VHWRFYPTRESARQAVFEYIEVFFNRRRVQKRLGYKNPIKFLNAWQQWYLQSIALQIVRKRLISREWLLQVFFALFGIYIMQQTHKH